MPRISQDTVYLFKNLINVYHSIYNTKFQRIFNNQSIDDFSFEDFCLNYMRGLNIASQGFVFHEYIKFSVGVNISPGGLCIGFVNGEEVNTGNHFIEFFDQFKCYLEQQPDFTLKQNR
jgi:hypothetical protein